MICSVVNLKHSSIIVTYYTLFCPLHAMGSFTRGQILVVELKNLEVIEGEYLSGCDEEITLVNTLIYPSKQKMKGPFYYYMNEILSISTLKANKTAEDEQQREPIESTKNLHNVITMDRCEFERLRCSSQEYIFMSMTDSRYHDAIDHMKNCENVGVAVIPMNGDKLSKVNLLVMSTWDQVYIFDVFNFNVKSLPKELREIFEMAAVKKIAHDSKRLVMLLHNFGISVRNLFDTQVADLFVRKLENGGVFPDNVKNLCDCLGCYFNFPESLFKGINVSTI